MYILQWKNPAVDPGKTNITVPVASTVSNAASLTFTGKGAANYGKVQQENLMRLLENFADGTAPLYPTVGQLWYDTSDEVLKLCTATAPLNWRSLAGVQVTDVGDPVPTNPNIGDLWFERTGPLSGFLYVYNGMGRFPISASTNGGWSQIWPIPQEAALRDEYDEMFGLVSQLLNVNSAGNGADGLLFTNFTNFAALDADLDAKITATPDPVVSSAKVIDLRAQAYSGDWDQLLYAARWAVNRLDLPVNMWQDVSPIPFVQDGRQPPSNLTTSYSALLTEPRFPTFERRTNRRFGMVTMTRLFAETMNVLSIAAANRYNLRGMAGNNSTNVNFGPEMASWIHCRRQSSTYTGGSATVQTAFNWANNTERNRFVYGGNAIEIVLSHPAAVSVGDLQLQTFLNKHNRFRITADRVRALSGTAPYTMTEISSSGLKNVIDTSASIPIAVFTEAGTTLTINGQRGTGRITLTAVLVAPGGLTSTTTVEKYIIKDCTAYGLADTDVFPDPIAYNAGTDAGTTTASFANVAVPAKPIANFSANATTVAAGGTVVLTWTGSGSPTLVEWDVNYDGVFEGTGNSYTTVPLTEQGLRYTVRVRATNAGGTDVLTRPAYITVT